MDINQQILAYSGNDPIVNMLKSKVDKGEELSAAYIKLVKKVLARQPAKKADVSEETKIVEQAGIDWTSLCPFPPFEHQKYGIVWLNTGEDRKILGDDMGLGKTFQLIGAAMEDNEERILVLCPNHLKWNWLREVENFSKSVAVIEDKWQTARFVIVNYDKLIIERYFKAMKEFKPTRVICDEAHYLKNMKAKRSKAFGKLIARQKFRVHLASGTILDKPLNVWNLLKICRHDLTKEAGAWRRDDNAYTRYGVRYCDGEHNGFGWDFSGASRTQELHQKIKSVYLRRTKTEHLDLPEKVRKPIYLKMNNYKAYYSAINDFFQDVYDQSLDEDSEHFGRDLADAEHLVERSVIRQYVANLKVDEGHTQEIVENALMQDKKVVVFSAYTNVIDTLIKDFGKDATYIDGRIKSTKERQKRVDRLNEDPKCKVLIAHYEVGSVGYNMTGATVSVQNDMNWLWSTHSQTEDRIWRIGQQHITNIYYPIYMDSHEEPMFENLMMQAKIAKEVQDGTDESIDPTLLREVKRSLLKLYNEKASKL